MCVCVCEPVCLRVCLSMGSEISDLPLVKTRKDVKLLRSGICSDSHPAPISIIVSVKRVSFRFSKTPFQIFFFESENVSLPPTRRMLLQSGFLHKILQTISATEMSNSNEQRLIQSWNLSLMHVRSLYILFPRITASSTEVRIFRLLIAIAASPLVRAQ